VYARGVIPRFVSHVLPCWAALATPTETWGEYCRSR